MPRPSAQSAPPVAAPPTASGTPLRVCVVAEFYPRADDPVLGIWAHQQALAARGAGAEVHVLVLHRPVPPRATRPRDLLRTLRQMRAQPREAEIDGIPITYVRFHSPPRGRSYGSWGRSPLGRSAARCAGSTSGSRSTSCTPTTRSPPVTPSGA